MTSTFTNASAELSPGAALLVWFVQGVIIVLIALLVLSIIKFQIRRLTKGTKGRLDDQLARPLNKLAEIAVWSVAVLYAVKTTGTDLGPLYAGVGIIALAAAQSFAAATKGILSNIFAGMQMAFFPPFDIEEDIEIGPDKGKIIQVTLTKTVILEPSELFLHIPNSVVINSKIRREKHGHIQSV